MDKICPNILSSVPDTLDFDFITIKTETSKSIYLNNFSDQNILFNIENAESFIFQPSGGIIPRKKKLEIKIKIKPDLARVLVSNARIVLENKYHKIIKMSYVAKYPFLHINKQHLEFGSVQIGKSVEKELILSNLESVPAQFTIEHKSTQPGKQPCIFYISDLSGKIPPKSNFLLKILYKPIFPTMNSNEIFCISTKGGNKLTFECKGSCRSLKTWVGTKCVNFKTVALGSQMKKLFRIYNDSDSPTEFQIYHDNSGAFSFDVTEGIVPAKSNIRIYATFRPFETIIYYQRFFCFIKNHMIFPIDLFGSCHNLLTKTPLIDYSKIEWFRYKELKGVYFSRDKKINKINTFNGFNKTNKSISQYSKDNDSLEIIDDFKDINKINMKQPQLHKEMFWESNSPTRLISFETDFIDFNFMNSGGVSEPYILKVNNNSNEDMKVKFIYDKPINLNNLIQTINIFHSENTVFFTQPEEQIIPKQSNAEFKVYFKPNKTEYYFFTNLPCQATIINNEKSNTLKNDSTNQIYKTRSKLININKNKLSEFGKELLSHKNTESQKLDFLENNLDNKPNKKQTLLKSYLTLGEKNNEKNNERPVLTTYANSISNYNKTNVEPPITLYLSMVGHSFPPGTQIFMPMFEFSPKKEIFFPPTSINQSLYQSLKIQNKNDTPLFYKIRKDPLNIFRVHNKYGLIPANSFHLICLEFSPKDTTVYRFPLNIEFNHDISNTKVIMLNGLCTDPVIEIEGVKNEIYFAPCYVGIKTKKTVVIKNLSPIHIKVDIKIDKMNNGILEVDESNFDLDLNGIKKVEFSLIPQKNEEINAHILITAERIYDPSEENIGIYNPNNTKNDFDKRIFSRDINVLGLGSDGDIRIEPEKLEFGTVKVGFHKKLSFSIYNPTITNFYIKLIPDFSGNVPLDKATNDGKNDRFDILTKRNDIKIDFLEGMLNSLCKKDINIQFEPITRVNLNFKINIYATDTIEESKKILIKKEKSLDLNTNRNVCDESDLLKNNDEILEHKEELKCSLEVSAKGDYPLIKIVDLRNNIISPAKLWKDFNVDQANEELQKKLTDVEMNYSNSNTNKKISDANQTLKIINFNFGKNFLLKNKSEIQNLDVFLTLKNEGGVLSEFFFKFPDDINIKREIWMDPVEPSSNDKIEYHVLKERIFTIEPKKSKLAPGECCNIRLRYSIKEKGKHRLRVLFQVVNGKPLIFELLGETMNDKKGTLILPKEELNFGEMPIGCMNPILFPFEIRNLSSVKIKYIIDKTKIKTFNEFYHGFEIFKMDNTEGTIGPNESKYLNAYFRPLADIEYKLPLNLYYTDDVTAGQINFYLIGKGYHPLKKQISEYTNSYAKMPSRFIYKYFNNQIIQKCGISIENLDFGIINEKKNKTFILYNLSKESSYNFDFNEPGFLNKDKLQIFPNKGLIEPGSYKLIKCILSPDKESNNNYEGDILIRITWNPKNAKILNNLDISPNSFTHIRQIKVKRNTMRDSLSNNNLGSNLLNSSGNKTEKENLYLRLSKRGEINDKTKPLSGEINLNCNSSFIELMLIKLIKEIFKEKDFIDLFNNNIENQPLILYKWTTNTTCSTLKETRQKFLKRLKITVNKFFNDLASQIIKRSTIRSDIRGTTHRSTNSKSMLKMESENSKKQYDLEMEEGIEEKYLREIEDKYKYKINEMNEKIILLNKDTKRVIVDYAVENTLYNIIADATNGQADLTEKQRIYFFLDKNMNSNIKNKEKNDITKIKNEKEEIENKIVDIKNEVIEEEKKDEIKY